MLKRLFAAFTRKSPPPVAAADALPSVSGYDQYGRRVTFSGTDWRDKMLLPRLEQNWNDPSILGPLVIDALQRGFADTVLDAARHVLDIDPDAERGHAIYGMALLKNGKPVAAAAVLRAGIAKSGPSAVLLTNLAKADVENAGDKASRITLWQAIELDPNFENSLEWWVAIQRDEGGEAGYLDALRRIAALPGSWRAQLWLARQALQDGDISAARQLYWHVLDLGTFDANALTMISGDLGTHGQIDAAIELVAPLYDATRHAATTGLNLLEAYRQTGRIEQAEALLGKLYALDQPAIKNQLDQFAAALMTLRNADRAPRILHAEDIRIGTRILTHPIWHDGLGKPAWLFAGKTDSAACVGFSPLAVVAARAHPGARRSGSTHEDDLGHLSRAVPLYLAEAVHYWTDFAALTVLPVVEGDGGGPVVFRTPEGSDVFDRVPDKVRWYVTGEITTSAQTGIHTLILHVWERGTRASVEFSAEAGESGHVGEAVLKLERAMLQRIGAGRHKPVDSFYARPSAYVMDTYLTVLGQSLMLSLSANGIGARASLSGERFMLEGPLQMALHCPGNEIPGIMYLAGLGKAMAYGSNVLPEFKTRTLELLKSARPHGAVANLLPVVWKAFGMSHELDRARTLLAADSAESYCSWLDELMAQDTAAQE